MKEFNPKGIRKEAEKQGLAGLVELIERERRTIKMKDIVKVRRLDPHRLEELLTNTKRFRKTDERVKALESMFEKLSQYDPDKDVIELQTLNRKSKRLVERALEIKSEAKWTGRSWIANKNDIYILPIYIETLGLIPDKDFSLKILKDEKEKKIATPTEHYGAKMFQELLKKYEAQGLKEVICMINNNEGRGKNLQESLKSLQEDCKKNGGDIYDLTCDCGIFIVLVPQEGIGLQKVGHLLIDLDARFLDKHLQKGGE